MGTYDHSIRATDPNKAVGMTIAGRDLATGQRVEGTVIRLEAGGPANRADNFAVIRTASGATVRCDGWTVYKP